VKIDLSYGLLHEAALRTGRRTRLLLRAGENRPGRADQIPDFRQTGGSADEQTSGRFFV